MVFNWVWKNMLGGNEGSGNDAVGADVKEVDNTDPVITTDVPNPDKEKDDNAVQVAGSAAAKDSITPSTDKTTKRKNKSIATAPSNKKKIRLSEPNDSETPTRASYPFDEMYAKLLAYKEQKGHSRVPQNYKDDRQLATWVKHLRRNPQPGKFVTIEQVEKLNAVGFEWEIKAGRPVGATIEAGAKTPIRKFRKPIEDDED